MILNSKLTDHFRSFASRTVITALLSVAIITFSAITAPAQWTTPDGQGNISNTNTGNVGIGTTNPIVKLQSVVNSANTNNPNVQAADIGLAIVNSNTTPNNLSVISFANSWPAGQAQIGAVNIGPALGGGHLFFNTRAAGGDLFERMRITSAGNVGIGTSSPDKLLTVQGAIPSALGTLAVFRNTGSNNGFGLMLDATGAGNNNLGFMRNGIRKSSFAWENSGNFMGFVNLTYSANYFSLRLNSDGSLTYHDGSSGAERFRVAASGNVGIGTPTPTKPLDVAGEIRSSSGGFRFPDGSLQDKAAAVTSVFGRTGAVVAATNDYTWAQINKTTSSLGDLATRNAGDLNAGFLQAARMPALTGDVTSSAGTIVTALTSTGVTAGSYTNPNITVDAKGRITAASNGSGGSTAFSNITAGTNTVALVVGNGGSLGVSGTGSINATSLTNAANITSGTVPITRLGTGTPDSTKFFRGDNTWTAVTSSQWTTSGSNINYETAGNVGIGIATPTNRLHVVGDGKFTGNLTVDGSINARYQDVAEWVPSTHALPAGTVVTLDPTKSNHVEASSKAYDTRVAGVVSAQPGIALGEGGESKVLVATTGRVRIKVDASHGPIQVGDLLVSSNVPGVAMKSKPIDVGGIEIHRPGTLIGKALEPFAKGQGEILVLLSLQ